MKLIVAIVQPHKFPEIKKALYDVQVFKMTVSDAMGCGQQKGYPQGYTGKIEEVNLLKKLRLEIAVNEDFVETTINAIIQGARTGRKGKIGDGKIFVCDLPQCIRVRTGERGGKAIG